MKLYFCKFIIILLLPSFALAQSKAGAFTPDISVNALLLYQNSNRGNDPLAEPQNGATLQESELQFVADVDPYTKFTSTFSIHPDVNTNVVPHTSEYKIEPEELFVDTLQLPSVNLRVGKFKAAFGRHNQMHTHAFPFVDAPLINDQLFGTEGLNDVGVSAAALIPQMPWFSEMTGQVLSGRNEGDSYFNSRSPNDSVLLLHYKNLWELTEELTAEWGLSGAQGKNSFQDASSIYQSGKTVFYGTDLTFKWRPLVGGKNHAIVWSSEYIHRQIDRPTSKNEGQGYASWVQYQFASRWWVQVRSEYLEVKDSSLTAPLAILPFQRKYTALLAFLPSEFSGMRLQYSHLEDGKETPEEKVLLQLNFLIGSHPAHSY